jgi:nucleotide-binding universal stress UspA family protein
MRLLPEKGKVMNIKRVLVPIDFSSSSLRALEFAVDLAKPFKAELVMLFAVEPILYVVPDYGGAQSAAMADALDAQRRTARAELARLERRYAQRGLKVRPVMETGRASQVIADAAKRLKADLIVMSTHGRTGVSRLLMGSVTERVVRTATCPVLTLHAAAGRAARTAPRGKSSSARRAGAKRVRAAQ